MKSDLRVALTERMLKEGLVRCLTDKPLSRITVSELCREAGVNRATFYNHYQSPAMVLRAITRDYGRQLKEVFESSYQTGGQDRARGVEACLEYLNERHTEVMVLLSENAENNVVRFAEEMVDELAADDAMLAGLGVEGGDEARYLYAVVTASAAYGLIRVWLRGDISKSPAELVKLLVDVFGNKLT